MTKKEQLELKFARLNDSKLIIVQMIKICHQNDNILECIKTSINSVQQLANSDLLDIPGYNELLALPLLSTSGDNSQIYQKLIEDNTKMIGYIKSVLSTLDNEMTTVAREISNCKE